MYKMCDRCRFSVPTKQALCHVCGSHQFVSDEAPAPKPLEAGLQNCKESLDGAMSKMQTMFASLRKEIGETAGKAQRATTSMRKLIFEAGPAHDDVLSFHRSIGGGRNVQFIPVHSSNVGSTESKMKSAAASSVKSYEATQSEPFSIRSAPGLTSDDNLFAPTLDFVAYMEANSLPLASNDRSTEVSSTANDAYHEVDSFLAQLLAPLKDEASLEVAALRSASVSTAKEEETADVDSIRKNIDDLKGWFESYGKEGLLVKSELVVSTSNKSNAAAELVADGAELEHARQAA